MSRPFLGRGGVRNPPVTPQAKRGRGRGTPIQHSAEHESHVITVGVKRPGFGVAGKHIKITANYFRTTIPDRVIHHYDVGTFIFITPDEKKLPARLNMLLIQELQTYTAPDVFKSPAVYDGRKNMFAIVQLPFDDVNSKEFHVTYPRASGFPTGSKQPKVYKIKLTKVAEINPEVLQRFIEGKQSYDSAATTAITAMNVVVRMQPSIQYTYNARSFFIEDDQDERTGDLRNGLRLWQGYFQSIRPIKKGVLINIDIATGVVFEGGPLVRFCQSHLKRHDNPRALIPNDLGGSLQDRDRLKLQRFAHGLRIMTRSGLGSGNNVTRVLRKFSSHGASSLEFTHNGETKSVAQYYHEILGRPLQYPDMICAEVGNGALVPLELCTVIKGQLTRQQVPPECARDMVAFASKPPSQRIRKITEAPAARKLGYATSVYVRQFGLSPTPDGPISINARVLEAPALTAKEMDRKGNITSKAFVPSKGAWNMDKKKFYAPIAKIAPVALFVLEGEERFSLDDANACFIVLRSVLIGLGVAMPAEPPVRRLGQPQGNIIKQLEELVEKVRAKTNMPPQLIIVILPELGNDLYTAVKHFGDVHTGIVTQCMKSSKCKVENPRSYSLRAPCKPPSGTIQYYSNVGLKINVKLGGINTILSPGAPNTIADPLNPTIVMGADAIHPAPGATGRPSYTALVGNIDCNIAKFVASTRIQDSRVEIIHDLKEMAIEILKKWQDNRKEGDRKKVVRLIFYRDGVSEGQFPKVLEEELAALKDALQEVKINAKITLVVVAKRHHVRFFPRPNDPDAIKGNCPPGTVVDEEVGHPVEFDFYLQSHTGILGTSRPSHYSVLFQDNKFSADTLQRFTYHLCYTYARATRAVSIPAPVYYADIVCSRAKNHYDPYARVPEADISLADKADKDIESHKAAFKPLHKNVESLMYFS
ncbi:Piwi-domain-containing protein [Macrolepiota fuliginosa MF-IS2]|uniref:Piwi-domain-containing protein n=1 Tax=Macrolepiota fuliginosa MF-IS2 TaxID=1400762 RepID=A0A9P6C0T2_9AGAR|nr:Piwi-domain-containing protein [Macrolepiota fuliginosa MF-IS2]